MLDLDGIDPDERMLDLLDGIDDSFIVFSSLGYIAVFRQLIKEMPDSLTTYAATTTSSSPAQIWFDVKKFLHLQRRRQKLVQHWPQLLNEHICPLRPDQQPEFHRTLHGFVDDVWNTINLQGRRQLMKRRALERSRARECGIAKAADDLGNNCRPKTSCDHEESLLASASSLKCDPLNSAEAIFFTAYV